METFFIIALLVILLPILLIKSVYVLFHFLFSHVGLIFLGLLSLLVYVSCS
jgi:hypothetical protein